MSFIGRDDQTTGEVKDCFTARSAPRKRRKHIKIVKSSRRHVKRKATGIRSRETGRRGRSHSRGRSQSHGKSNNRGRSKSRGKSAGRRSAARGKGKIPCMRAGPVTRNGFLNFMREFRRKNCGLNPRESFIKGAQEWKSMTPDCKAKYIRKAKKESLKRLRSAPAKC